MNRWQSLVPRRLSYYVNESARDGGNVIYLPMVPRASFVSESLQVLDCDKANIEIYDVLRASYDLFPEKRITPKGKH